jgi:hypothetical protein
MGLDQCLDIFTWRVPMEADNEELRCISKKDLSTGFRFDFAGRRLDWLPLTPSDKLAGPIGVLAADKGSRLDEGVSRKKTSY